MPTTALAGTAPAVPPSGVPAALAGTEGTAVATALCDVAALGLAMPNSDFILCTRVAAQTALAEKDGSNQRHALTVLHAYSKQVFAHELLQLLWLRTQ